MAVDLGDFIDVLRREVTPPGSSEFGSVSDEVWLGYLADAFWEARLDGFLEAYVCDSDGLITPLGGGVDLPRQQVSLVVLYAGIKILRNKLINTQTQFRVKAGPVEYETQNSANVLTNMLAQLQAIKERLLLLDTYQVFDILIDGYAIRQLSNGSYAGYVGELLSGAFGGDSIPPPLSWSS